MEQKERWDRLLIIVPEFFQVFPLFRFVVDGNTFSIFSDLTLAVRQITAVVVLLVLFGVLLLFMSFRGTLFHFAVGTELFG